MIKKQIRPSLEHTETFLQSLSGSKRTRDTYRQALMHLATCIADPEVFERTTNDPGIAVQELKDDVLVRYYEWLTRVAHYRPRTVAVYLAAARRFLVWLDAHDTLPPSLSVSKALNRLSAIQGRTTRPSEVARPVDPHLPEIVTYYDNFALPPKTGRNRFKRLRMLRNRAIVQTLYASAGRASEVASLTRAHVLDGKRDEVFITGKGGKDRVILLSPEAQSAIAAYCSERTDFFPGLFISHGRNKGKPLGRWALWKVVKDAVRALGLYQGTSPHDFRHYRAQQLLHEGMDLDVLQAYLGHADIATTRRVYAPYTELGKVKDQLATFGRSAKEAASDTLDDSGP